jgi:hypothetical protein
LLRSLSHSARLPASLCSVPSGWLWITYFFAGALRNFFTFKMGWFIHKTPLDVRGYKSIPPNTQPKVEKFFFETEFFIFHLLDINHRLPAGPLQRILR